MSNKSIVISWNDHGLESNCDMTLVFMVSRQLLSKFNTILLTDEDSSKKSWNQRNFAKKNLATKKEKSKSNSPNPFREAKTTTERNR